MSIDISTLAEIDFSILLYYIMSRMKSFFLFMTPIQKLNSSLFLFMEQPAKELFNEKFVLRHNQI
jgi:hypothetical protein